MPIARSGCVLVAWAMVASFAGQLTAADTGTIQFRVNNDRQESLPCRIHLVDAAGKPQKALGMPFWNDHFVCPGSASGSVTVPVGSSCFLTCCTHSQAMRSR